MHHYKAVCFDFDYTLGDCTESIVAGFQYGLTQMGWPVPDRDTIRATVGYSLEDSYTMLTGDSDPHRRAQFRPYFVSVAVERQRTEATLFPGAVELIRGLNAAGVKTAIVSTKRSDTISFILERYGLSQELSVVIGGADVKLPKPDPQGLHMAMDKLGVTPDQLLFCGDTILDAGAAKNAGCDFAAVLLGTTKVEGFSGFSPVHFAPDLWDLARWLGL